MTLLTDNSESLIKREKFKSVVLMVVFIMVVIAYAMMMALLQMKVTTHEME